MRFGISIFPTDYAIPIAELAPAVEARGFDSLWVSEHTHLPRQPPDALPWISPGVKAGRG